MGSMPQGRLAGKVALVTGKLSAYRPFCEDSRHTGGGSGFGAAITKLFVSEGAKVFIGDINTTSASDIASSFPNSMLVQHMNVAKREDWDAALKTILDTWGQLDIIVNNAGTSYKNKPTTSVTQDEYERCFDVNVMSIFHSVNVVFPYFVERKQGICVNISSCGASRPRQGLVWYNASKGAVSNVGVLQDWGFDAC